MHSFVQLQASQVNSAFTTPTDITWKAESTLGKPLYALERWRWRLPSWFDTIGPWHDLRLLAPVDRTTSSELVPPDYDWRFDWEATTSATRALITTALSPTTGQLGPAHVSEAAGDSPVNAPHTVGFATALHGGGLFAFGGADSAGTLSGDLWFGALDAGEPLGGGMTFEKVAGGGGQSASAGAGSSTTVATSSVSATSSTSATSKSTCNLACWKKSNPPTTSRLTLAKLIAPAKAKWLAKAASKKAASKKAMATAPAKTLLAPSFASGSATPQADSVLAYSPQWWTLTIFYGDTGTMPTASAPVELALFDLQTDTWTVGQVDWNETSGNRRNVGYVMTGPGQAVFFGGEAGGQALDGLYTVDLDPGTLLSGVAPQRLDGASQQAPAPRTHAALGFDSRVGSQGAVYLMGGINSTGQRMADLWVFALDSGQWRQLSDGTEPGAPPPMVAAGVVVSTLDSSVLVYPGTAGPDPRWGYRFVEDQGWQVLDYPDAAAVQHAAALSAPTVTGCFAESAGGTLSATSCSGQREQGFELRAVPDEEGLFEIVRLSDGKCMRLDGQVLTRQVGDRVCEYIAWGTAFTMGACGDERARFDVISWPTAAGYEVRQRFACTQGGAPAGHDTSSCVDAGVGQTLHVYECSAQERQRILAPGWPTLE